MGGKTTTSTQSVSIPPEVMARYNAVNTRAENVAATPFQPYTGQFVAPINPTQQAGIEATGQYAQAAQPYYGTAAGLTLASAMPVSPGGLQTGRYMSPFTQAVVDPTVQALRQQQGQQLSQQQSDAIRAGAFGGDRAGIQRAVLQGQQQLGMGQAIAPIYQQGFQQAQNVAQQQQQLGLSAAQANRQAMQAAGAQLGGLGTAAQQAALQGAQAQIGAGTLQQQTEQAQNTAQYQQFLQERGYPFQVAQFLANIAMGTGALSGSTTTTTQPASFFSDRRLKHDVKEIGETKDGLKIYSFKYNGDDQTHIGLMAQDVEKKKPEAVGLSGGYKTVDYEKATEDSDRHHREFGGGLMPDMNSMGGGVLPGMEGQAFARGGYATRGGVDGGLDSNDLSGILQSNQASYQNTPFAGVAAQRTGAGQSPMGGAGYVPKGGVYVPKLLTAGPAPRPQESTASQLYSGLKSLDTIAGDITGKPLFQRARDATGWGVQSPKQTQTADAANQNNQSQTPDPEKVPAAHGGVIPRRGYSTDGGGGLGAGVDNKNDVIPGMSGGSDPLGDVVESGKSQVRSLQTPGGGGPGGQRGGVGSDLMQAAGIIGAGKTLYSAATALPGWLAAIGAPFGLERGGVVPRHRYATDGGVDDEDSNRADVPSEAIDSDILKSGMQHGNLAVAGPLPAGGGGGGGGGDAVKAIAEVAKLAAMFANRGGVVPRHHYQFGGGDETQIANYSDEADLPAVGAQEAQAANAPDYRAMAIEKAKKYGVDPAKMVATIQGESSFNPTALGDEGSSAGLGQYHVAGISKKYPNPGLGDDYFRDRRPDLADKLSPAEKIAFLRDPANQEDKLDHMAEHASKKGWSAWTAARNLGFAGNQADRPAPRSQEAQFQFGAPSQDEGGLGGFFARNKNVILPVLQGLGAMAGSKSRYLGSAILEGLGAGAKSYSDLEKQQAETGLYDAQTVNTFMDAARKTIMANPANPNVLMVLTAKGAWIPYAQAQREGIPTVGSPVPAAAGVTALRRQGLIQAGMPGKVGEPGAETAAGATIPPPRGESIVAQVPSDQNVRKEIAPGTAVYYDTQARTAAQADAGSPNIDMAQSQRTRKEIEEAGSGARATLPIMNELTQNTAALIGKTPSGSGAFADPRMKTLAIGNYMSNLIFGKDLPPEFDPSDLQLNQKLRTYFAGQGTNTVHQNSLQSFKSYLDASPSGEQTPTALAKLTSTLMVQNMRAQGLAEFARVYGEDADGRLSGRVVAEYDRLHGRQLQAEQNALADFFVKNPKAAYAIASGKVPPDAAAQKFKEIYKNPNLIRYFQVPGS